MGDLLEILDRRWRNACKVVLKGEVGALNDFLPYLQEYIDPLIKERSSISGKEVSFAFEDYCADSRRISFDEAGFGEKFEPLSINEIKDIDSVVEAVRERVSYSGNVILGNSSNLEKCSNVSGCHYLYGVSNVADSKYLACCSFGRLGEDLFGTYGPGESQFCIRCSQTYNEKRCFEVWNSQNCSDSYYCYGMNSVSDCIFSFNQKNRRHLVGNLELDAAKYNSVKEKLLGEIREELQAKKRADGLIEIIEKSSREKPLGLERAIDVEKYKGEDMGVIEREFSSTCKLLFGKELAGIENYRVWLTRHAEPIYLRKSAASGKPIYTVKRMIGVIDMPSDRLLTIGEAQLHGEKNRLAEKEAVSISLHNAHGLIGRLAYLSVELREGNSPNMPCCSACIDSANCYWSSGTVYSKYCGFTFWPRSSQNAFGCHSVMDSSFCINCYRSHKLSRCAECDTCRDCSDSYFCHNCENVHDSMFCFNAKNLSHAIGNAPLPVEKYKAVKSMLLSQISDELLKKKDLKWDIFNVGKAR